VQFSSGTKIHAYFASQIASLRVKHEVDDIVPDSFDVHIQAVSFQAKIYSDDEMHTVIMKSKQLPLVSNSPMTGHKLQGSTLGRIAVFEQ
jgi:hypothetical protein